MRPFSVRTTSQEERLVRARDLVDALVVARATWPEDAFVSVIEAPEPPRRRPGWQKGRPRPFTHCGWCGQRGHNARTCPDWDKAHQPVETLGDWLLRNQPQTLEQAIALDPPVEAPRPTRVVEPDPADVERTPDGVRLCECGEPSISQKNTRVRTCQRCRDIEEASTHRGDHVRGAHPTPNTSYKVNFNPTTRLLPQLDSRTIHSGLAEVIREMNRLKPFTTM